MSNYPVTLNLAGKPVVVVGGGKVARRKVLNLLNADAQITVISPEISQGLHVFANEDRIRWIEQVYRLDTLTDCRPVLIFAATDKVEINQQVAADADTLGIWCNVANDNAASNFHNMAAIKKPPLTIALSSQGMSPALIKLIKMRLEEFLGTEYSTLAAWLGDLRSRFDDDLIYQPERQRLYETIVQSDILDLLSNSQVENAKGHFDAFVREVLPS